MVAFILLWMEQIKSRELICWRNVSADWKISSADSGTSHLRSRKYLRVGNGEKSRLEDRAFEEIEGITPFKFL
jgi:hypothetical protein